MENRLSQKHLDTKKETKNVELEKRQIREQGQETHKTNTFRRDTVRTGKK